MVDRPCRRLHLFPSIKFKVPFLHVLIGSEININKMILSRKVLVKTLPGIYFLYENLDFLINFAD